MYRVRSLEINYLDNNGKCYEKLKKKFDIKPICKNPENVLKTVEATLKKEVKDGYIKKVIIVSTNKGKFYYN